jgi:hypothetical protein
MRMKRSSGAVGGLLSALAVLVGSCGGINAETAGRDGDFGNSGDGDGDSFGPGLGGVGGSGGTGGGFSVADGGLPDLPPEEEVPADFELPQASERYVYAANPAGGTVSIVEAETLAITTLQTGDRPTYLRTLTGTDDAIVLNVGSNDATLIRMKDGKPTTVTLDVVAGANAIALAPDGKHAVVYFDSRLGAGSTSGSFQDVSVITLEAGKDTSVNMTVAFQPGDVFFDAAGKRAFVVTRDGISVLDFASVDRDGSGIARLVALGSGVGEDGLDVSVTPDGRFALARAEDSGLLRLVDLDNGLIRWLDLADVYDADADDDLDAGTGVPILEVTDLDLAPSGGYALAALRTQSAMLRIPVPEAFDDPTLVQVFEVPGEVIGSVSIMPGEAHALLYTTAVPVERMTLMSLGAEPAPRTVVLRKAVRAVAASPNGDTALILHAKADGSPNDPGLELDTVIDRSFGYSLLRVATGDVKLQITPVEAGAYALTGDGGFLFLLLRDDATALKQVQQVELKSFLVESITLGSPPISVGAVPTTDRVFVGQEHPDGRVTFIEYSSGEVQTVTGFELNSRIRD